MLRILSVLKGGLAGNYAHHSCFIAAVFLQMQHGSTYFPHMFPLFYIGEISTIFLDLRFFFHKFGKGSGLLFDLNQGGSLIQCRDTFTFSPYKKRQRSH